MDRGMKGTSVWGQRGHRVEKDEEVWEWTGDEILGSMGMIKCLCHFIEGPRGRCAGVREECFRRTQVQRLEQAGEDGENLQRDPLS